MKDVSLAQINELRLASPCPMKWEDMAGDDRVRFCGECSLNVYNFSDMTPKAIVELVQKHDGERLCAGWYRRADGTMITRDCPVGLRLVRQKLRRAAYRIVAAVGLLFVGSMALARPGRDAGRLRTCQPFSALCEWLAPTAAPPPMPVGVMMPGRMAPPNWNNPGSTANICTDDDDSGG